MTKLQLAGEHLLRPNDRPPPADGGLQVHTWWTNTLTLEESVLDDEANEESWMIETASVKDFQRTAPNSGYLIECGFLISGIDFYPIDNPGGIIFVENTSSPRFNFSSVVLTAPRKFFWLLSLACIIIPTISVDTPNPYVNLAVWTFGIMANVPSIYTLANPPLSSSKDGRAEVAIWKVARGWSVSFGPVFALIFVMLLRAKLLREKRKAFGILLFVVITLGILILMLATREGSWGILDLLSICVSWCAVVSYMIVDELRIITTSMAGDGDQTGLSQRLQTGRRESAQDVHSQLEAGQGSVQNDSVFTLGDDSTLDGRTSRVGS